DDGHPAQHECQRYAQEKKKQQGAEEKQGQCLDAHQWPPGVPASVSSGLNATAMSCISLTMPCSSSRKVPTGMATLTGHIGGFHAEKEVSMPDTDSQAMELPKYSRAAMKMKNRKDVAMSRMARVLSDREP